MYDMTTKSICTRLIRSKRVKFRISRWHFRVVTRDRYREIVNEIRIRANVCCDRYAINFAIKFLIRDFCCITIGILNVGKRDKELYTIGEERSIWEARKIPWNPTTSLNS